MYAVITENDSSKWDDKTGVHYHFPSRYLKFLSPGTKVIYYKGRLRDKKYIHRRLSAQPHYFGKGTIGQIKKEANGKNYYATIIDYVPFSKAIPFKRNKSTIEKIPSNRTTNYWRDGVRPINQTIYNRIVQLANVIEKTLNDQRKGEFTTTLYEGGSGKKVYTTRHERNRKLREDAVRFHGYSCKCCKFNFGKRYGEWGEGYVHVHHIKPISSAKEKRAVNPKTDLVVVCANCHSMIHRRKNKLLTVEELRKMLRRK